MQKFSCPIHEASCMIGNLITELEPPCICPEDHIALRGKAYDGTRVLIRIKDREVEIYAKPELVQAFRRRKCNQEKRQK